MSRNSNQKTHRDTTSGCPTAGPFAPSLKKIMVLPACAKDLSAWPERVRDGMAFTLTGIARGLINDSLLEHLAGHGFSGFSIKSLSQIRAKVFEIRTQDARHWYRLAYTTEFRDMLYVLHAFLKKTNETSRQDCDVILQRVKQVASQIARG